MKTELHCHSLTAAACRATHQHILFTISWAGLQCVADLLTSLAPLAPSTSLHPPTHPPLPPSPLLFLIPSPSLSSCFNLAATMSIRYQPFGVVEPLCFLDIKASPNVSRLMLLLLVVGRRCGQLLAAMLWGSSSKEEGSSHTTAFSPAPFHSYAQASARNRDHESTSTWQSIPLCGPVCLFLLPSLPLNPALHPSSIPVSILSPVPPHLLPLKSPGDVTMRACAFSTDTGLGAFAALPLAKQISGRRAEVGVRYSSPVFTTGAVLQPATNKLSHVWLCGRHEGLTCESFFGGGGGPGGG